jgi:hypothetical protein
LSIVAGTMFAEQKPQVRFSAIAKCRRAGDIFNKELAVLHVKLSLKANAHAGCIGRWSICATALPPTERLW